MVRVVLLILLIFKLHDVGAKTLEFQEQCGAYRYIISVDNPDEFYGKVIKLYFQKPGGVKKLFYRVEDEHIDAFCVKNKNNKHLFLFNEQCFGNACRENIYGLFNPEQGKFLLKPQDWPKGNDVEVMNILGVDPLVHFTMDKSFCCTH